MMTRNRCTATCAGLGAVLWLASIAALAQAPVDEPLRREQAIQRSQQATGVAYRQLQQAQYESKLAEQEFLNAQEVHHIAQQHAEERKRQLDAAKKALDAAKAKEAQLRKRYEQALTEVDRAFEKPLADKK
jgi:biopolymer transport protein ExbB/TolQ